MTPEFREIELCVPAELAGERLDSALARLLPEYSRSRIKQWIAAGGVVAPGGHAGRRPLKPSDTVDGGVLLRVSIPAAQAPESIEAEALPLAVVGRSPEYFVIDKPAGLVVHPGAGNRAHTLQNALLALDPGLAAVARAGIVHRLDKDTSGLLVVARTPRAQTSLVRQLQQRSVKREYEAFCNGVPTAGGAVDEPIGRHRSDRLRMAVRADGRAAVTHFRVVERFRAHARLRVRLETGRTHQIRVHFAHLGHPLIGDRLYGGRPRLPRGPSGELADVLRGFDRQALHAARLEFDDPASGERRCFDSPLPADLERLLEALRADRRAAAAQAEAR